MQVLVTGGTGFVGSYVLRELSARGHRVHAIARSARKAARLSDHIERLVVGSLDDPRALAQAVAGVDAIVHVAGTTSGSLERLWQVNVQGTAGVLQAAARGAGQLERFVYVSSIAAAGPSRPGTPHREEDPPRPVSRYGKSKLAAEEKVRSYGDRFATTVVRTPVVYGPGDTWTLPFFKMVQRGRVWSLTSPATPMSLVFVSDLATGIADAVEHPAAAGQTFYLTGDARPELQELLAAIEDALGTRAPVSRVPVPAARALALGAEVVSRVRRRQGPLNLDKREDLLGHAWICSGQKARSVLGFKPEVDFREGIRRTAEWYVERGWLRGAWI